jgi:hypothetical protein
MDGRQRAQLQRKKGTRPIVEELDRLRMEFGFDHVQVLTPIVEIRLRAGFEPPKPLKVSLPLNRQEGPTHMVLNFVFQLGYPTVPVTVELCNEGASRDVGLEEEQEFLLDIQNEGVQDCCEIVRRFKEQFLLSKADVQLALLNESELEGEFGDEQAAEEVDGTEEAPTVQAPSVEAPHCSYCCKICGTVLFESAHLHEHSTPKPGNHNHRCTSYYLEDAPTWLNLENTESDKLHCTKCKARVGTWSWAGGKCSCEAWITPAFQFVKSKLDEKFT